MNASERDQLQQFLSALRQTRAAPKDPTAEALIHEALNAQADAPYVLVQRAMVLGLALETAQTRIQQLEAQCAQQLTQLQALREPPAQAAASNGSWLSGEHTWGRGPEAASVPASAAMANTPPSGASGPAAMPAQAPASAWGSGMLAQVASTAAGVVAGGLLFQGMQSLMGHHPHAPNPSAGSPTGSTSDEALSALPSTQALADDAGDASWDAGDDWA